jgi:hypothetical protein
MRLLPDCRHVSGPCVPITAQAPPAMRRPMPCSTHQLRRVRSDLRAIVAASPMERRSSPAKGIRVRSGFAAPSKATLSFMAGRVRGWG